MNKYLKRVLDFLGIDPSIDNTKEVIEQEVKLESNIQEPVISFIKCFKANPKRFVFDWNADNRWMVDTTTNEVFNFVFSWDYNRGLTRVDNLDLNKKELEYLHNNITSVLDERKSRKNSIIQIRKNRTNIKNRERLTQVYR
jgi:FMN-dependent NADH-azoreductase